eukprot:11391769-Heterocapsa_arctica.AAC.1
MHLALVDFFRMCSASAAHLRASRVSASSSVAARLPSTPPAPLSPEPLSCASLLGWATWTA